MPILHTITTRWDREETEKLRRVLMFNTGLFWRIERFSDTEIYMTAPLPEATARGGDAK